MEKTIQVNSPDGTYPIYIKTGILDSMTHYADFGLKTPPLVITDSNLESIHAQAFADKIGAGCAVMPAGESHKNLATVSRLYSDAIRAKLDRSSTIIAFGGGVVGDVAGFVASTYMRGVGFIQIPTSLLAMVDSSVGGKVGVDLPEGKNLVGAFKQPIAVYIDPAVLGTLPPREWGCGMAEIIKHGLLADETLLDPALHHLSRAEELVTRAVQVKVDVVQRDPYEAGERAHLNLGHTFGHAVEHVTHYAWAHGEAVGFGLLAATMLSHRLGLCDESLIGRVEGIVRDLGLPIRLNGLDPEAIYAAMFTDKKWASGKSRFVLIKGVGMPTIVENVAKDDVLAVLSALS
jgi:3-dehydroquinate synthase